MNLWTKDEMQRMPFISIECNPGVACSSFCPSFSTLFLPSTWASDSTEGSLYLIASKITSIFRWPGITPQKRERRQWQEFKYKTLHKEAPIWSSNCLVWMNCSWMQITFHHMADCYSIFAAETTVSSWRSSWNNRWSQAYHNKGKRKYFWQNPPNLIKKDLLKEFKIIWIGFRQLFSKTLM